MRCILTLFALTQIAFCAEETALTKLKENANNFILKEDKEYEKWKKKLVERIKQKMIDSNLTLDAVETQFATDFISDNRLILKKGPKDLDKKFVINIARHIKYMKDKEIIITNWEIYEKEIKLWSDWFEESNK